MKKVVSTGVTLGVMVLLLGGHSHIQAQVSGVPASTSAGGAAASSLSGARNCAATARISFAATNGAETIATSSTTFVDLPPLSVTFSIPGTSSSCLNVELSAVTFAPGSSDVASDEIIYMRVLLDGTTELLPGEPQWSADDEWARAHAANFYASGVSPGVHTVMAQWRSAFGKTVFAHWRSMGVHHK
jgi:hypothetical protein